MAKDTDEFIRENVPRGTASPETRGVSSLKGYGEGEEAVSIRRSAREALRGLVGMRPYEETNPSEAYRIAATPTPLAALGMIGRKGLLGILDKAKSSTAFKGRGLDVAEAEQFSVKKLMDRLKEQGLDVDRTWLRGKKDPGRGFEKPPTYEYLEAVYETQKRPDAIELALRDAKQGRPWSYSGTLSRQSGDRDVTKYNTKGGVWLTESPTIAESYSGDKGFIIPVLTRRPEVVLDAKGEQWDDFFKTSKEFKEAQRDPNVKSIEVKNIIDFGGRSKLPFGLSDDELRELLTANNLFLKKPFVDKDVVSKLTGEPFPYQDGGPVNVPRGTSEVPRLTPEGQLIDEREEIRSESQRMLNRLQSQPSKLPPGIRRAVAATREQDKESMFPAAAPARDLLSGILGASPTVPGSQAYRTGQAIANMPPVQAAAAIPAKIAASAGDAATALAAMGPAVGAVMKPKGGNWLAPSVERGLNYLIPRTGAANRTAKETLEEMNRTYPAEELARMSPETRAVVDRAYQWLEPNVAVQNWIEKKLTKYVKNEMATPEDPVRALAERGILHVDPEQLNSYPGAGNPTNQAVARRALSYPEEGLARSEAAKRWETASDYMIQTDRALNLLNPKEYGQGFVDQTLAANPWLTKVDPYERIYGVDTLNYRPDYSELGFDHLIDELKNSLNPNSGLPRALQLTPKQLDKVSVPQAVELVDKINKWRAEQKAAADFKRSQNAATVEYKAYDTVPGTAEPNKRGLRWVELKPATMSEDFVAPDRYSIVRPTSSPGTFAIQDSETGKYITTGLKSEEQARKHLFDTLNRQQLEDALKYEGEVMGHCVGGYCPDVSEGRSRIYSLRDAKGEPHVTVEVKPARKPSQSEAGLQARAEGLRGQAFAERVADLMEGKDLPPNIVQIKGKANRAPKDEYLPFVQDFVRSGRWSSVGDFKNTGLIRKSDYIDTFTPEMLDSVGVGEYMTKEEFNQLADKLGGINKMATGGAVRMKDGGEVNVPRGTSTSKQQLDKLAQVSKRKKA